VPRDEAPHEGACTDGSSGCAVPGLPRADGDMARDRSEARRGAQPGGAPRRRHLGRHTGQRAGPALPPMSPRAVHADARDAGHRGVPARVTHRSRRHPLRGLPQDDGTRIDDGGGERGEERARPAGN